jgi:hypothetical protein
MSLFFKRSVSKIERELVNQAFDATTNLSREQRLCRLTVDAALAA